jgi:hypothetical protein
MGDVHAPMTIKTAHDLFWEWLSFRATEGRQFTIYQQVVMT